MQMIPEVKKRAALLRSQQPFSVWHDQARARLDNYYDYYYTIPISPFHNTRARARGVMTRPPPHPPPHSPQKYI